MSNDDLFQAFNMLKEGAQQLKTSRVLEQANEQTRQIRTSEMNEQQKRQAMTSLADQIAASLYQTGSPAAAVQQLSAAFRPQQFANADQAILEGSLTGNSDLVAKAIAADSAAQIPKMAAQEKLFEQQIKLETMKEMSRYQLASMKEGVDKKKKDNQADIEFATNASVAMKEADKLEKLIKAYGNAETLNPTAAAQLKSAAYQLAVNYAKIVDPASVAREGEVDAAKKYMIPLGWDTRNSVSTAAIQEYKAKLKEYIKSRQKAKEMGAGQVAPDDLLQRSMGGPSPSAPNSAAPSWQNFIKR